MQNMGGGQMNGEGGGDAAYRDWQERIKRCFAAHSSRERSLRRQILSSAPNFPDPSTGRRSDGSDGIGDDDDDGDDVSAGMYPHCFVGQILLATHHHQSVSSPQTPRAAPSSAKEVAPALAGGFGDVEVEEEEEEEEIVMRGAVARRLRESAAPRKDAACAGFSAWEGGVVAAQAEQLNSELHELLADVRQRNEAAAEVRRALCRSRLVSTRCLHSSY